MKNALVDLFKFFLEDAVVDSPGPFPKAWEL
jgi:hypothetical protein